mgnify:CR=1 FL=1
MYYVVSNSYREQIRSARAASARAERQRDEQFETLNEQMKEMRLESEQTQAQHKQDVSKLQRQLHEERNKPPPKSKSFCAVM